MDDPTPEAATVTVRILDQSYLVRSSLDRVELQRLADYVQGKMRTITTQTPHGDLVRVAVLAALNIADDYFRCREHRTDSDRVIRERTAEIEAVVDRAIRVSLPPSDDSASPEIEVPAVRVMVGGSFEPLSNRSGSRRVAVSTPRCEEA